MHVSLFNGFADKNPKPITIREVVEIIRADQRLQVFTENHRRYRAVGDFMINISQDLERVYARKA